MLTVELYVILDNEVEGPYTAEEVCQLIAAGRIRLDSLAAFRGTAEWKRIEDLLPDDRPVSRR